ncbi:ANTAR domain-containing protein [Ruania halotolerans]|uniref:ANTAR domain-containing protein n=1 Tax=Ruania halotolerans TaxID=2897773 RepID=UPI001E60E97A|nr:GAF and ANTAR domain-containing protein [Ruania halotolerans]UFU05519.1 GAF and ANTAR domain-containing protein [Ruania halotolerans]
MYDGDRFVEAAIELTEKLVQPLEINEALFDLADRITSVLELAGSGVVLMIDSRVCAATAVPPVFRTLETFQEEHQEGPCVTACRTGEIQAVADLRTEERWPGYQAAAEQVGVRAVVGVPMKLAGNTVGAINLYSTSPRDWHASDLSAARVMTNIAAGYLISAAALARQTEISTQLQHALDSRVLIEQAKGVLAEALGIEVDRAYERLRHYARSHGRKAHDVAREIVAGDLQLSL